MRAVRRENTRFHRVCKDAYERFLERHVQGMEEFTPARSEGALPALQVSEDRGHAQG